MSNLFMKKLVIAVKKVRKDSFSAATVKKYFQQRQTCLDISIPFMIKLGITVKAVRKASLKNLNLININ